MENPVWIQAKDKRVNIVMREREVENTTMYHQPLIRVAKMKKKANAKFGEAVEKLKFSYFGGGYTCNHLGRLSGCMY